MYIKDLTNGTVRRYGTNVHDSLQISDDGRTLSYENLQNGDGSRYGDYRFCDSDGQVPEEDEVLVKHGANAYFNIGGFSADPFRFGRSAFSKTEEVLRLYYKIRLSKTDKAKELCQKVCVWTQSAALPGFSACQLTMQAFHLPSLHNCISHLL